MQVILAIISTGLYALSVFASGEAPGAPGKIGSWQRPDKTAYGTTITRPVWFTVAENVVGEITYPSVDLVQTRDSFIFLKLNNQLIDERRLSGVTRRIDGTLAYSVESHGQGVSIKKEISAVSDSDAIVLDYKIDFNMPQSGEIIFVHNPMASGTPGGDLIETVKVGKETYLLSKQGDIRGDEPDAMHVDTTQTVNWSLPTDFATVGFEGSSAPEDQLQNRTWPQIYSRAGNGNISGALVHQFKASQLAFRVVIQFHEAKDKKVLENIFSRKMSLLISQQQQDWGKYLSKLNFDRENLKVESSILVLKALEDKVERGAFIAGSGNPSLPWQIYAEEMDYENSRRRIGDSNFGYRRVWPRDLFHKALAFISVEDFETPIQIVRWYRKTQFADGWWSQNMFVDGSPSWQAYQQDQTGFPVILVTHLVEREKIGYTEFRPMVRKALNYILKRGPFTEQERWEENGGLSLNSLAVAVQALHGGAWLERNWGDKELAQKYSLVATQWTKKIKTWALIPSGRFGNGYFARIEMGGKSDWDPTSHLEMIIKNKNAEQKSKYFEDEILDLGFVQWIIAGLISPFDSDFYRTVDLCDKFITKKTKYGLGYLRYSEDSYGENHLGGAWPLLNGERLLVSLERKEKFTEPLLFIEGMFTISGMLGEQDTLAIRPLGWSHANYLVIKKSIQDNRSLYRFTKAPVVMQ